MTNRLSAYIIDKLRTTTSFTAVAREVNLSVSTVIRIFDLVSYATKELPVALSIDELKGNTSGEKYQCILTDPVNKVVLDILPKRYESYLTTYFNAFSKEERGKVKYFVSDMWKTYSNISSVWLKTPHKSLTNIIGFDKLFGLLRRFANKNKRNSVKPIENISKIPDDF